MVVVGGSKSGAVLEHWEQENEWVKKPGGPTGPIEKKKKKIKAPEADSIVKIKLVSKVKWCLDFITKQSCEYQN